MVDLRFILGDFYRHETQVRLQRSSSFRTTIAHLHQVLQQIEKLLATGKLLDQSDGHQRLNRLRRRLNLGSLDPNEFAIGISKGPKIVPFFHDDARDYFAFVGPDRRRFVSLPNRFGWLQNRFDQLLVRESVRDRNRLAMPEPWAGRCRRSTFRKVACCACQRRLIKNRRAANRIANFSGLLCPRLCRYRFPRLFIGLTQKPNT